MFSSFDGSATKKRNINLGGNRKVIDKDALLRSAQLEREKRELERSQLQNAIKIQSLFRGHRARRQFIFNCRAEWDSIQTSLKAIDSDKKPWSAIQAQLLLLSNCYDYRLDLARMEVQLHDMIRNCSHLDESVVPSLTRILSRFLCQFLNVSKSRLNNTTYELEHMKIVQMITELFRKMYINVLVTVIQRVDVVRNAAQIIQSLLLQEGNMNSMNTLADLISSCFRTLQSGSDHVSDVIVDSFTRNILCIPGIWSSINVAKLRMDFHPIYLLKALKKQNYNSVSSENAFYVALNLVRYCYDAQTPIANDETFFNHYALTLHHLFSKVSQADRAKMNSMLKKYDDDIDSSDEEESENSFTPYSSGKEIPFVVMSDVLYTLELSHQSYILHNTPIDNMIPFFTTLLDLFKVKQKEILISLSPHMKSLLPKLVGLIKHSALVAQVSSSTTFPPTVLRDETYLQDWNALSFFCTIFSSSLSTISDGELRSGALANIEDIILISGVVKKMTYALYMTSVDQSSRTYTSSDLTKIPDRFPFVTFLNQIHSRDSRRKFCPDDHWLVPISGNTEESLVRTIIVEELQKLSNQPTRSRASLPNSRDAALATIFKECPFMIPFETRVSVFRGLCKLEKRQAESERSVMNDFERTVAKIRRNQVFEDGFATLNSLGKKLKRRVQILFFDEHGIPEAGIDGGGVFKEFLTSCLKEAFNPNYGLFDVTKDQLLYPSPYSITGEDTQLRYLEFLGRIIGKALYEGVLIDANLAGFFLRKWLGRSSSFEDLPSLDQELFQGLMTLKNYEGDVSTVFGLNFTIDEMEFGKVKTIELMKGGEHIMVTNENRVRYVYLVAHYKLNIRIAKQCRAFFTGLIDLIKPEWLRIFNEHELQILLGGASTPIDIQDMRRNTTYSGVYDAQHPTIQLFWKVAESFSDHLKTRLVKFITSCQRPPLLGFKELQPRLGIRDSSSDQDRLPSASTCVNLLKLPIYSDEKVLREKLTYAIEVETGFGLS